MNAQTACCPCVINSLCAQLECTDMTPQHPVGLVVTLH